MDCGCMLSSLTNSNSETTFSRNFANLGTCKLTCCEPPDPVNLVCVVDTTLSPFALSSFKGMHTSVPVSYLLYWDGTVTVVWMHLSQYPLFIVGWLPNPQ